jgi:hypothetical protein
VVSSGSDAQIEVDYALGGGSSGARLGDVGASRSSDRGAKILAAWCVALTVATVSAAGEHGAIDWHPFGAQGNWQGEDDCSGGAPARAGTEEWSALAGIVMPAIELAAPLPTGDRQAYPLSTSTSWRSTNVRSTPIGRRSRRTSDIYTAVAL